MILFEVTQAQIAGTSTIQEMLINTGQSFKSQEAFRLHAEKNGADYAGRSWELWGRRGTNARVTLKEVPQYKLFDVKEGDTGEEADSE